MKRQMLSGGGGVAVSLVLMGCAPAPFGPAVGYYTDSHHVRDGAARRVRGHWHLRFNEWLLSDLDEAIREPDEAALRRRTDEVLDAAHAFGERSASNEIDRLPRPGLEQLGRRAGTVPTPEAIKAHYASRADVAAETLEVELASLSPSRVRQRLRHIRRQIEPTRDARVQLLHVDALPAGWLGKSHACWSAAGRTMAPWLLFLDADARLTPDAVTTTMRYAEDHRLDLLSLLPRSTNVGFWEHVLVPLAATMITLWYGLSRGPDAAARQPFVSGAFMLIRREAYVCGGGHEAVKAALIEDLPLAARLKKSGARIFTALGRELVHVRMYDSLSAVVAGWRRIYIGTLTPFQIVGCLASIFIESLLPFALLPVAAYEATRAGDGSWWPVWMAMSSLHLLILMTVSVRFFRLGACDTRYLWVYPLSCLGVAWILLCSLGSPKRASKVKWKDTTYDVRSERIIGTDASAPTSSGK